MDIKFILNDALNKALINKDRIKGIPSSDKIGDFVNKYVKSEQLLIQRVSDQRELLTAFLQYGKQRHYTPLTEEQIEALVNDFEGSL